MEVTRLGAGVDANHRLAHEAIERTVSTLAKYRAAMDEFQVGSARLIATSAVRDAGNGQEFLRAASTVVGVPAEMLSGIQEANLAYKGATKGLGPVEGRDVVVDIGGGSTEVVLNVSGGIQAVSLDIGCVRVSERFFMHDPPDLDEITSADELVTREVGRAMDLISNLGEPCPGDRLIGLAGTVSTLSALEQGLDAYEYDRLHHTKLTREAVERWYETLRREPSNQRAQRVGIPSGREDVIVGGVLILYRVMKCLGFESLITSESDILDGTVSELLAL